MPFRSHSKGKLSEVSHQSSLIKIKLIPDKNTYYNKNTGKLCRTIETAQEHSIYVNRVSLANTLKKQTIYYDFKCATFIVRIVTCDSMLWKMMYEVHTQLPKFTRPLLQDLAKTFDKLRSNTE